MIDKVKQLFKGHDELILGFNTFLPKVKQANSGKQQAARLWCRRPFCRALTLLPSLAWPDTVHTTCRAMKSSLMSLPPSPSGSHRYVAALHVHASQLRCCVLH